MATRRYASRSAAVSESAATCFDNGFGVGLLSNRHSGPDTVGVSPWAASHPGRTHLKS